MKKYLGLAFAAALAFGTAGMAAQNNNNNNNNNGNNSKSNYGSHEQVQDTKTTTDNGTFKTSADRMFGKVEKYQPGQSITITTPGHPEGTRTIDLTNKNETPKIASSVKVGEWVSVVEKTDRNGRKTITVKPSKTASREQTQR